MIVMSATDREKILALVVGIAFISSARIFVAGAFSSIEVLFFYGVAFPSFIGVLALLIASIFVSRMSHRTAGVLMALYAISIFTTDWTQGIHIIAALVIPVTLALLAEFGEYYIYAVGGMVIDISLRVLATGGEPIDFLYTRILLAMILFIGAYLLFGMNGKLKTPSFRLYTFLMLMELGLAYPNALLRYSGINVYYLREFVVMSIALGLLFYLTLFISLSIDIRILAIAGILLSIGVYLQNWLGVIFLAVLAGISVAMLPRGKLEGKISEFTLGTLYFVIVSVLAVGAYVGRDIGLPFMENNLEVLIILTALLYSLLTIKGSEDRSINILRSSLTPIAFLFISALVVLVAFHTSPATSSDLKIWTYNLHMGFDPHGHFNGRELVKLIESKSPDVIASQEVIGGSIHNAYQDLPLLISSRTGMTYEYKPTVEGTYGIAVFSKSPIHYIGGINLGSIGQTRPAMKVSLDIGRELTIVNVHMGLNEEERAMQAEELLKFSLKEPKAEILLGDFNAPSTEEASIGLIEKYYSDTFPIAPEFTWHWGKWKERDDYIFLLKDSSLKVKSMEVIKTDISDHYPMEVVFELP
ncbi:endonuclease/exonuclease/phosphatase family protein [Palaeococcus sp. (in: euryarchaeotes)]|uniref:endonuclease/exonuclease/phosphatase family protein n=1 Tax=Palaeococcus sp. (in: euryarchaeotes) TaxID=2820298 RepID=UPI0025E5A90E|nr:endonuclease/exonuclease/phosphatase family protein [Palaeococcus sp. (in: euryarchaeotes)]